MIYRRRPCATTVSPPLHIMAEPRTNRRETAVMIEDVARTAAFYRDVLGFEIVQQDPAPANPEWVLLRRGAVELMFQARASMAGLFPLPAPAPGAGRLTIYVDLADVASFYREVAGRAAIVCDLHDTPRGTREFSLRDCNGFTLTFAEPLPAARRAA